jgi:hypothetical protein
MTNVGTKLELMVAQHLGPVIHELNTLLSLSERAIAAAHTKSLANTVVTQSVGADCLFEDQTRQAIRAWI